MINLSKLAKIKAKICHGIIHENEMEYFYCRSELLIGENEPKLSIIYLVGKKIINHRFHQLMNV
jgi:hypothetical protein